MQYSLIPGTVRSQLGQDWTSFAPKTLSSIRPECAPHYHLSTYPRLTKSTYQGWWMRRLCSSCHLCSWLGVSLLCTIKILPPRGLAAHHRPCMGQGMELRRCATAQLQKLYSMAHSHRLCCWILIGQHMTVLGLWLDESHVQRNVSGSRERTLTFTPALTLPNQKSGSMLCKYQEIG